MTVKTIAPKLFSKWTGDDLDRWILKKNIMYLNAQVLPETISNLLRSVQLNILVVSYSKVTGRVYQRDLFASWISGLNLVSME